MKRIAAVTVFIGVLVLAGCVPVPTPAPTPPGSKLDMINPASKYCTDQGYKWEIRSEAGGEAGYCIFPDGSACDEWAFFRGECAPGGKQEGAAPPAAGSAEALITARMLVQPNALMGPGLTSLSWSPKGATLGYVLPEDGRDVLWLYQAATGERRVLLDPTNHEDGIDVTSAQWSPEGDAMLLTGEKALWLLDVDSGRLDSLVEGAAKTAVAFSPTGDAVSFVQDNDLYVIRIGDGQVQRLTTDGSDTIFNGTLDWVYNEEFATRVAQPAYAWSPDGKWLLFLRLDDEGVQFGLDVVHAHFHVVHAHFHATHVHFHTVHVCFHTVHARFHAVHSVVQGDDAFGDYGDLALEAFRHHVEVAHGFFMPGLIKLLCLF